MSTNELTALVRTIACGIAMAILRGQSINGIGAEDIAQDLALAYERMKNTIDKPECWAKRAAYNMVVDLIRAKYRREELIATILPLVKESVNEDPRIGPDFCWSSKVNRIIACVAPDEAIFIRDRIDGYTFRQMAERHLGDPSKESTIRSRLSRIFAKVRRSYPDLDSLA